MKVRYFYPLVEMICSACFFWIFSDVQSLHCIDICRDLGRLTSPRSSFHGQFFSLVWIRNKITTISEDHYEFFPCWYHRNLVRGLLSSRWCRLGQCKVTSLGFGHGCYPIERFIHSMFFYYNWILRRNGITNQKILLEIKKTIINWIWFWILRIIDKSVYYADEKWLMSLNLAFYIDLLIYKLSDGIYMTTYDFQSAIFEVLV